MVSGDPNQAGAPFVMRFRYRGVARVPPHWHPTDEHITVLSGTFMVGMGERFDESSGTELPAGAYAFVRSKMPHYAWTKGDTVVQIHGIGPFTINYVNPADDPNKPRSRSERDVKRNSPSLSKALSPDSSILCLCLLKGVVQLGRRHVSATSAGGGYEEKEVLHETRPRVGGRGCRRSAARARPGARRSGAAQRDDRRDGNMATTITITVR